MPGRGCRRFVAESGHVPSPFVAGRADVRRSMLAAAATGALPNGYRPAVLEFRILGPLEVVGPEGPVQLGGPKQRATLAILLLNANRVVSIDRLADQLYAGRAPVTAATQVHRQISELRKTLGEDARLETRSPGYVIHVASGQLDLKRFERLTEEAGQALARGEPETAFELQRDALALWRGPALAGLDQEQFAQIAIGGWRRSFWRLSSRGSTRSSRSDGTGSSWESSTSWRRAPTPRALRLPAHACALPVGAAGRRPAGLSPHPGEARRWLRNRARPRPRRAGAGDPEPGSCPRSGRSHRASGGDVRRDRARPSFRRRAARRLLAVAEPLARLPGRSLLIARLLPDEALLASTVAALNDRRASLGLEARTAAFTTVDPVEDAVRLADAYDVRLILLDTPDLDTDAFTTDVASLLERAPADVGLLNGAEVDWEFGDGVCVPFAGGEHDWAALELGAWLASSRGIPLRLLGTRADARRGRRDASRLLADASLSVQRASGVDAVPQLIDPAPAALVEAVESATIVVTGMSASWRRDGLGETRRALVRRRDRRCWCTTAPGRVGSLLQAVGPDSRGRSRARPSRDGL